METSEKVSPRVSISAFIGTVLLTLFTRLSVLAQNVSDSDLSNSAGTNKNWYGSWWLIALVIAVIVVLFIAFNRRRSRNGKTFTNEERRR